MNNKLLLEQFDRKLMKLALLSRLQPPGTGWIRGIRLALGMTLMQLGARMGITPQSVKEIEDREQKGTISLKVLNQFADVMDMKLVYGFIPRKKNLSQMIEDRALEIAKEIVLRTSNSMELEAQKNSAQRLDKAIRQRAFEIKEKMPRYLWD